MVNCSKKGCDTKKTAIYAYKKDDKKRYCLKHKLKDMFNISVRLCDWKDCNSKKRGKYAFKKSDTERYCSEHKSENMYDVTKKVKDIEFLSVMYLYYNDYDKYNNNNNRKCN